VSTFLSTARARALRPIGTLSRPRLTIVPKAVSRAPRIPFVVFVVALLATGLVGLLVLNTSMERGTYVAGALRAQSTALAQHEQELRIQVSALEDPQRVARRAERLGMVQNNTPAFLVLGSGRVVGSPAPGVAGDTPDIALTPPGALKLGRKILQVPAGAHTSEAISAVTVPGRSPGHRATTNADDTARGSADRTAAGGTNVPSAQSHHSSH
jgi:hypothetical protein